MDPVDENEAQLVAEFRKMVSDTDPEHLESWILLKFIRARSHNLKKAEEQWRKSEIWREDVDIKSFRHWEIPAVVEDELRSYCFGDDFDGEPSYLIRLGELDARPLLNAGLKEDIQQFVIKGIEMCFENLKFRKVPQANVIIDIAGLSFAKATHFQSVEFLIQLLRDFEAYYPECLKRCFIINTSWMFHVTFNIVKKIISSHTLSKVHVYDHDETKWKSAFLDYFPAKSLPPKYGGVGVDVAVDVMHHCPLPSVDIANNKNE